jgi:hypothetical protein
MSYDNHGPPSSPPNLPDDPFHAEIARLNAQVGTLEVQQNRAAREQQLLEAIAYKKAHPDQSDTAVCRQYPLVNRKTLNNHIRCVSRDIQSDSKLGGQNRVLSPAHHQIVIEYIARQFREGFPVTRRILLATIQTLLRGKVITHRQTISSISGSKIIPMTFILFKLRPSIQSDLSHKTLIL